MTGIVIAISFVVMLFSSVLDDEVVIAVVIAVVMFQDCYYCCCCCCCRDCYLFFARGPPSSPSSYLIPFLEDVQLVQWRVFSLVGICNILSPGEQIKGGVRAGN